MATIHLTITGKTPLLMHRFSEETQEALLKSGARKALKTGEVLTPRDMAEKTVYRLNNNPTANLCIPGVMLYSAIVAAGRFHKSGRASLTNAKSSIIPGGLLMRTFEADLGTTQFEVDSRRGVNPNNGVAVVIVRGRLDRWEASFDLDLDTEMFSNELVYNLVRDAGTKIGIGSFRPACRGPYGTFNITHWDLDGRSMVP